METLGLNLVNAIDVCWYSDPVELYAEVAFYQKFYTQTVSTLTHKKKIENQIERKERENSSKMANRYNKERRVERFSH